LINPFIYIINYIFLNKLFKNYFLILHIWSKKKYENIGESDDIKSISDVSIESEGIEKKRKI